MEPSEQAWVYKILRAREWQAFREPGVLAGSADDLRDGVIHRSARDQVEGTRAKYFAAEPDIVILRASATQLGSELRWEPSRGGALFPHLYRPLRLDEVEVCATV
ncbi:MAG: DUF952 domain-containing protein [Alphaproteobacteria bacterium]